MATSDVSTLRRSTVAAVTLTSAALLMTELALTRIFSVTMYYHFAFLAISIALFGLSASGVLRLRAAPSAAGARATGDLLAGARARVRGVHGRRARLPRAASASG